jgi:hypothetical protein
MLVMLSCGKNSNQIVNTVKSQIDNVDFHCYFTVDEFISQSNLRHLAFDRLVFTSKFISTEKDMGKLCDYVRKELNSVEIVMIVPKGNTSQEEIFKKYFDSPMYTVMYVDSPTTMCIVDSIKEPIQVVKARYYTLDKQENQGSKKSKISAFKGGKKEVQNNSNNSGINFNEKEVLPTSEKVTELPINNAQDYSNVTLGNNIENGMSRDVNPSSVDLDKSENSEFQDDVPTLNRDQDFQGENDVSTTDDFDLSIGEYGSQHSDSGFVGDDDLSELEAYAHSKEENLQEFGKSEPVYEDIKSVKEDIKSVKEDLKLVEKKSEDIRSNSVGILGKYNIVTGLNGSGVTAYVVKRAMAERNKGKKVAIIDLDISEHGVLSFIDTDKYYKMGKFKGISGCKPYIEDDIAIFSDGYGFVLQESSLYKLVNTVLLNYDVVLFDCPLELLNVIPDSLFNECTVLIGCISDISKLIETSDVLSDRRYVSLKKEIEIANRGIVANKFIKRDDINFLKEIMLFPNGCWLK